VELFFRWLKCVLGCKQLLTTSENGVAIQIYTALIASLLIVLWTGRKPVKRTWEMLQFYFQGWASLDEVQAHLEKQGSPAEFVGGVFVFEEFEDRLAGLEGTASLQDFAASVPATGGSLLPPGPR
jgi:hypothetical protein